MTSKTSPDAGTVQQKYDKGGNLRFVQDAKQAAAGQVYFTTCDFGNRPVNSGQGAATFSTLDPDAAPTALETTKTNWLVVRAYDAKPATTAGNTPWDLFTTQINALTLANVAGRVAAVASKSNGSWQTTLFSYDTDGRVATRYTYTHGNGGTTVLTAVNTTVTYTRNLTDALTQRSLTVGASTFNQWYDYDGRGLLWKAFASTTGTKPGTPDATFTYRPSGQLNNRLFLGGSTVPLKYTIREQLERIGDPTLTTYPFSAKYSYHLNGTISEAEFYNAGSPATAKRYRYAFGPRSYDALNRLKSADFSSWSGSAWTTTQAHDLAGINYDVAGNLTALQRYRETATLLDNLTYTNATTSNRLTSVTDAVAVTPETWDAETGSFTYDANGNLATAPAPYAITAVTYDHQNLPTALTKSGVTSGYRYTEAGHRITKQVGAGNTEVYVLEGSTALGVFTVTSGGTVASSYFTLLAGEKPYGRQPNTGNRKYYHSDLLGSTRSVVEGATVVESYDFEPWGLAMPGRTLGSGTKEGFTGKEQDAETGLDYFGARYYLPALGRFGAVDPEAGQFAEWSPYNYTLNNPVGVVDRDGGIPLLLVALALYQAYDVISGAIDAYQTAKTVASGSASGREKATAIAGTILGGATPLPGKAGRAVVDKVVAVVDKFVDATRSGKKVAKAADGAVETVQETGKFGGDAAQRSAPDFVVASDGTAIPVSQSRMREGFDNAGFPSRGATETAELGRIHEVPTPYGPMDVRTMEGGRSHPYRRVVTRRPGTNDATRLTGERFKQNEPKKQREGESHMGQKP